ncbi:MAG: 3-methyl-2-oxobutanoate hydroxymethyltransferase [Gammaproteobacteria bacterium]|nr:3-methyl-2-oxobutanoate hydroxymethyltransferase [Gammaproteobacteria bacterium]
MPTTSAILLNHLDLLEMKEKGEKIVCLTAYDASFSAILDASGVDLIMVGDSLGSVIQGHPITVYVKLEEMVYHARCVARGRQRALLVVDLPFLSYSTPEQALQSSARLIQEGQAQMVKLEGGGSRIAIVSHLVEHGIPVCGHLGLLPQSIHQLGRYSKQGKDQASANTMLADAVALEQAGASVLVLECVPSELAKTISERLDIPVIGIGAGADCDGQVLVLYDLLGISKGYIPAFSRNFMDTSETIKGAVESYVDAVRTGQFP